MQKLNQLGWVIAASLGAVMLAGGFEDPTNKFAVVDMPSLINQSNLGKQNEGTFTAMKKSRQDLLEFIDMQRMLTNEQAQQLRDLMLKQAPSDADKAKIASIQADVVASRKKNDELAQKTTPLTPEERTLMDEYARRNQTMQDLAQRWYQEFMNEMQNWAETQKLAGLGKARAAIAEVAKAQGDTVVFEASVAPYGANDITDAALKAMNARG